VQSPEQNQLNHLLLEPGPEQVRALPPLELPVPEQLPPEKRLLFFLPLIHHIRFHLL
jgi:hypothetical protein